MTNQPLLDLVSSPQIIIRRPIDSTVLLSPTSFHPSPSLVISDRPPARERVVSNRLRRIQKLTWCRSALISVRRRLSSATAARRLLNRRQTKRKLKRLEIPDATEIETIPSSPMNQKLTIPTDFCAIANLREVNFRESVHAAECALENSSSQKNIATAVATLKDIIRIMNRESRMIESILTDTNIRKFREKERIARLQEILKLLN